MKVKVSAKQQEDVEYVELMKVLKEQQEFVERVEMDLLLIQTVHL